MKKLIIKYSIIGVVLISFIVFIISSLWTGSDVRNYCNVAKKRYGGDCVEAMISALDDKYNPYDERNQAIWVLGQLGDPRATPYLNKYYTGKKDETTDKTRALSQSEIAKALKLTTGSLNLSAFIWRRSVN